MSKLTTQTANNNYSEVKRPETKRSPGGERFSSLKVVISAFLLAAILNTCFIVNAIVPSGSMEPTIPSGQAVIGWRPAYLLDKPERGDIVIFRHEDFDEKLLKRIVGLPGDTIEVNSGGVWVNGQCYAECTPLSTGEIAVYIVPDDSYFVMGDNLDYSFDSRRWENPYIKAKDIVAKVIFGYFPKFYIIK